MTYRIPPDLAWVLDETDDGVPPTLYLMKVPDGVPLMLTGTAALMWIFAVEGDAVAAALADVVANPPADLAETMGYYVADLVGRGLLLEVQDEVDAKPPVGAWRMTDQPKPLRILFICTANISRSPYAERRAAQLLADLPMIQVSSAGIPGYPGRPMDDNMATVLRRRGASGDGHVSRSLTWEMMALADVALTFQFAQHMHILDEWPDHAPKVMGLLQFADIAERLYRPGTGPNLISQASAAARPDGMTWDIFDPHGRGMAAAVACAAEIDDALARLVRGVPGPRSGAPGRP